MNEFTSDVFPPHVRMECAGCNCTCFEVFSRLECKDCRHNSDELAIANGVEFFCSVRGKPIDGFGCLQMTCLKCRNNSLLLWFTQPQKRELWKKGGGDEK